MNVCKIPSAFFGEITIFHYPAESKAKRTVLILKGLYGEHIPENPQEKKSWDNQLAYILKERYDVFLFNTSRHQASDKKEKFMRKTYQDECDDVERAFIFCKENILHGRTVWGAVAMSFGGTVLLGCPDVLQTMRGAVMIGSGCGKSPTATKPLVSTLRDTPTLLQAISKFNGSLYFLHGGKDTVVPFESQKKIYESATESSSRGWIEFPNLDHELNDQVRGVSYTAILAEKFLNISLS
jgi:hypothetical protein